jgi:multidrug transporter EmrE-like cation transporter
MSGFINQTALLIAYSLGMIAGQMLFKLASSSHNYVEPSNLPIQIINLVANPFFAVSVILYLVLSVFWVWILTFIPISKAYPFVALSFAGTAIGGWMFFGERLSATNLFGLALLGAGIVLATR